MKNKKRKRSLRRIVIDTFTGIMFMVFLLSMCAMDSENIIVPAISLVVSFGWCAFYAWAKGWMMGSGDLK